MTRRLLLIAAFISLLAILSQSQTSPSAAKVLIFSRTIDFRHDSIPTAINAFKQQSSSHNVQFDNTEDQTLFTDSYLSRYDAIIFLMNTGQVLDDPGIAAFQNWVDLGGNFVGIHAASDCLRNNTFFQNELGDYTIDAGKHKAGSSTDQNRAGAHFRDHANLQNATVIVLNSSHPSTSMLPQRWAVQDEMYHFKSDPRAVGAVVLLSADTSTFTDQTAPDPEEGSPSPKAWYQERGAGADANATGAIGRSWYTSLGHLNESWEDSTFMAHVMGGLTWALASNTTLAFNASAKVGNPNLSPSSSGQSSSTSATGLASSSSPTQSPKPSTATRAPDSSYITAITATCVIVTGLFVVSTL